MKETVEIKELGNDKFLVKRRINEELTRKELSKIHDDIKEALVEINKQLKEFPKQVEKRVAHFKKEKIVLTGRMKQFAKYIKEEEPKKEK